MRNFNYLHFFIFVLSGSLQAQYSKEVEEKIRTVEQSVGLYKFQVEGLANPTIEDRMRFYNVKGLSIAVVHNYKIEWAKGYGWADSAERRPVTTETLFEPGSISKSINAVGILRLAQRKKIDLYKDINDYLVSWKFPYDSVSKNKKITLADLLSHTAGLSQHGFPGYYRGDTFPTVPEILDGKKPANTKPVRSLFVPGLKFEYSGGGTMVSQLIVMDKSEQQYDAYMSEHVFVPIGMSNSLFTQPPPEARKKTLATGYSGNGKEIKGKYPILIEQAAGGLWTTPTDLCKFIIEIQLSRQGKSNKVLSKKMTKKMLRPYQNKSAALGCFIEKRRGAKYFSHNAGNQGFSGIYYGSFKDGNGLAIVVNSDEGHHLIQEVVTSVVNTYKWKGFYTGEKVITKKSITVSPDLLEKYVGAYKQKNTIVSITKKEDGLYYQAGGQQWKMYFDSDTTFFSRESVSNKLIHVDKNGKVLGFTKKAGEKDLGTSEKVGLFALSEKQLDLYTGKYMDGENLLLIFKKGNHLFCDSGYGNPLIELHFLSATEFYIDEDFGAEDKFILDEKGNVKQIFVKHREEHKSLIRVP